jgi:hypothetical protein
MVASVNLGCIEYYLSYVMHNAAQKPQMELELHGGLFSKNSESAFVCFKDLRIKILDLDNAEL